MYSNSAYKDKATDGASDMSVPLAVTSCGYYKVYSGQLRTYRPRGREDYQLLYVASGRAYFFLDGIKRPVTKGSMVLYRPGELQLYYYYAEDRPEVWWVHFTGNAVEEVLERYGLSRHKTGNVFFTGSSSDYEWLYGQMIRELGLKRVNYAELLEMNLRHIFLMINRYLSEGQRTSGAVIDEAERAIHYFNENYNGDINIEEYAARRHMSACWFIKCFKEVAGVTPMQYVVSLRINNAMQLLDDTNYSIAEAAEAVGYDNALYFSRLFKRHTGMSPSEYRKGKKK